MPSGPRGVICLVCMVLGPGCFAEEGFGDAGGPRSGPETLTSRFGDGGLGSTCAPLGNLTGITRDCDGFADYTACVERECADGYDACLGSGWPSGDFSEGSCGELMQCIVDAPDPCEHGCTYGGACESCLVGQLSICETYCAELADCSGVGGDPSAPTAAGPCGALATCCSALEPAMQEICAFEQQDARLGGDAACEVLLLRYCP